MQVGAIQTNYLSNYKKDAQKISLPETQPSVVSFKGERFDRFISEGDKKIYKAWDNLKALLNRPCAEDRDDLPKRPEREVKIVRPGDFDYEPDTPPTDLSNGT